MDPPATAPPTDAPTKPSQWVPAGRHPAALTVFVLVAISVFAADLGLKTYAFNSVAGPAVVLDASAPPYFGVPHHESNVLIPHLLSLHLTANNGAIFGMGKGSRWVFIAVSIVAIGFISRVFWHSPAQARLLHVALALIIAGAMGNLYDRLFFAVVRDMLYMFPEINLPFGLTWPGGASGLYPWIFNIADVALLFGVLTVVWVTWKNAPPPSIAETSQD
jgi:signal peptidase II